MTSRERVYRCLEFRSPDRAPRNLWFVPYIPEFRSAEMQQVLEEFPDDFCDPGPFIPPDPRSRPEGPVPNSHIDDWGSLWVKAEPGMAGEVKACPIADWSALSTYRAPWFRLENARWHEAAEKQEENLKSPNPCFMMGWSSVRPFERMQFLRGSEQLFLDLGYDEPEVWKLRDLVHEYDMAELEGWAKTPVDGVCFMDDWGSQTALLISPEQWRAFYKPLYADYCRVIRGAGKKVFFHSDGFIEAIYPDLLDLGVDAVNSQLFCMDIEGLARRHKGKITFWGELNRQGALAFGTPPDIRRDVARVRRALDDGRGGLIANFTWGAETPIENVRAAYQAWHDPLPLSL